MQGNDNEFDFSVDPDAAEDTYNYFEDSIIPYNQPSNYTMRWPFKE